MVPFLDTESHGVFATRAPARPNRIGLSIVRLESVEGCTLHFTGNDMLDQTPVLDIKPYVPRFDVRSTDARGLVRRPASTNCRTAFDDRTNPARQCRPCRRCVGKDTDTMPTSFGWWATCNNRVIPT